MKGRTEQTVPLKAQTVQGGTGCYFQTCVGVRITGLWKQLLNNRMWEVFRDTGPPSTVNQGQVQELKKKSETGINVRA